MEKGEVVILTGQFLALAVLVLLLGNYISTLGGGPTTTQAGPAYWGGITSGVALKSGAVNSETTNASVISVYFEVAQSTRIASLSASRLCLTSGANATGEERAYTTIPISYDPQKGQDYVSFGPTGQPLGVRCDYTFTITDTLQSVATWTGTVEVVLPEFLARPIRTKGTAAQAVGMTSLQDRYAPCSVCFGCGPANEKGLRIKSVSEGDEVICDWTPEPYHHAFQDILNGGITGPSWTATATGPRCTR